MRLTAIILIILLHVSVAHAAEKLPGVDELIKRAIASLENSSYEGRMRYSDPYGNGEEKLVEITFASPARFRVQPLISDKQKAAYYYIENSERLVKIYQDGAKVVEMPERLFIIDNLLRRRLLEALAGRKSVSLLKGVFNDEPVWILRDDGQGADQYSITIHISERNDYPISLQMIDGEGKRVQFYEMDNIRFLTPAEIRPEIFTIPGRATASHDKAPTTARPPMADVKVPERSGNARVESSEQQLEYKPGKPSTAQGVGPSDLVSVVQQIPFPLMPLWLPKGYQLNAISPLDYSSDSKPMLVYQLELYNPFNENVISIFETRSQELEDLFIAGKDVSSEGYFVGTNDEGWLVAVFGSISQSQFDQIFDNLEQNDDEAYEMISRTLSREELRRWAEDVCTREANPVP